MIRQSKLEKSLKLFVRSDGRSPFLEWLKKLRDQKEETLVVLLIAGDKSTQDEDIKKAKDYWKEYKKEKKDVDYRL